MPRPQRTFRTQAIILKRRDLGEADRLLTLVTLDYGKLNVVAKGARKPTSTKTGHVELFTRADVLISKGRDLDILSQAELIEPYLGIREDLQRGAYANYIGELLDRFTLSGEDDMSQSFGLLSDAFKRLSEDDDVRLATRYYEMHLLDALGFKPELMECVIGREPIIPIDQFFSVPEGGIVCREHMHLSRGMMPISMVALKLLRHIQRSPYPKVKSLKITEALHDDVERIMLAYITYVLETKLQSVDFIRHIRRTQP